MSRFTKHTPMIVAAMAALWLASSSAAAETIQLFNGKNLDGWRVFLDDKNADPKDTFSVKDGVIHDAGKPAGYIITDQEFDNYVLKLQWRWPGKGGNSGVFVHVIGEDKIWPKGIEAQLQSGAAGDFWLVDGAKLNIDEKRHDKGSERHWYRLKTDKAVEKPEGEWNQYEITVTGDHVKLVVNGQLVNEGTNPDIKRGRILLQSEGAPIEFRNIELTPIK